MKTVERFLQDTTSEQIFSRNWRSVAYGSIRAKGDFTTVQENLPQDGKGRPVASQKLGERYSDGGLSEQIHSNQVEQISRQSYERAMAGIFANFKDSDSRYRLT